MTQEFVKHLDINDTFYVFNVIILYSPKNQYQLVALYYLFVDYFSDMFRPELIRLLQGDF